MCASISYEQVTKQMNLDTCMLKINTPYRVEVPIIDHFRDFMSVLEKYKVVQICHV